MPIPSFREDGWLPAGHHSATWDEVAAVFAGLPGSQRARLLKDLLTWRDQLRARRVTGRLLLDGSFISAKPVPGDLDILLIADEGVEAILSTDEDARRLVDYLACKESGLGDVFFFSAAAIRKFPSLCRLDVFDFDKHTRQPKGVLMVRL